MSNSLSKLIDHKTALDLSFSPLYKVTVDLNQNSYANERIFEHVVDVFFNDSCICLILADGCCVYYRAKHVIGWIAEKEVNE